MTTQTLPPHHPPAWTQAGVLGLSLSLAYATAAVGAMASVDAGAFYSSLQRPSWAPPAWLFGPAWSLLYTLMAIAAWLLWQRLGWRALRGPLLLYLIHLPVNGAWSWVFFVGQHGAWATVNVLLLLVMIIALVLWCWQQHRLAALLLLPYVAWVGFASALCIHLWLANPALL
ncbi:MAG: tryptophan-rich sensory protein [Planctomycetota bacterium]|nr:MAG: tryptophan-rich sensory protein [Planctomycetota bacterium]